MTLVNSQSNTITSSSLSEAQAIVSGRCNITLLEETMELHHIGNFLELPILTESKFTSNQNWLGLGVWSI